MPKLIIGFVILLIFTFSGCVSQNHQKKDCDILQQNFDDYIERSALPIVDSNSLCHGLYVSSDFSKLPPKWAVGKLINLSTEFEYSLTFEGVDKTGAVVIPLDKNEISEYEIGKYYKIDMNNICPLLLVQRL
jgi:hypothetical protein